MYCGGFGRDVSQAILKAKADEMLSALGSLSGKATPVCQAWGNSFHLKFEDINHAKDALDVLKITDWSWKDDAEETDSQHKKIFVKLDKSVAERTVGKYHSKFYQIFEKLLDKKERNNELAKGWKLRIVRGQLAVLIGDNLFPVVKFSKEEGMLSAEAITKWNAKVSLSRQEIEDSVAAAIVLAKSS